METRLKIVPKGWGFEKWIVNNEKYCGKILYIVKDHKCSWHYHKIKDETFYVQSGKIELRVTPPIARALSSRSFLRPISSRCRISWS